MANRSFEAVRRPLIFGEDGATDSTPLDFSVRTPRVQSLDEVIGLAELKDELHLQLQVWSDPSRLIRLGGKARKGFVFCGPPGTGKTTTAHALSAETGRELYTFSGADFQSDSGRDRLLEVITKLKMQKAIVFIDEADDLLHMRDFRLERSGSLVKTLLVNFDQTTQDIEAFFIFATNMTPSGIDEALQHAGRLGRPLIFRHLTMPERVELLNFYAKKGNYVLAKDIRFEPVAAQMSDVPTANLAHLLNESAFIAYRSKHDAIDQSDLQEASVRLRAGLERRKEWTEDALTRTAAHEAGHVLVRLVTRKRWDSIGFVQLSQRVEGEEGATHPLDEIDDGAITERRMIDVLAEGLGGMESERLMMGDVSNGSMSDLRTANKMADRAAAAWVVGGGGMAYGPRTGDEDRYWGGETSSDMTETSAQHLLIRGQATAAALLRHEFTALTILSQRLREFRFADADRLKEWLSDLLPMVE